jgi:hypothetical protein
MEAYHGTDVTQFESFAKLRAFVEENRGDPGSFVSSARTGP